MKKCLVLFVVSAVLCGAVFAEDGWISLFNGKDLSGWKASESKGTFSVENGMLIVHGNRSHLFYEGPVGGANFKDFEWKAEVKTFPKANSGMYIHTEYQESGWPSKGYEVQVNTSHSDPKKTGGLYGIVDVMDNAPSKDGEWFTQHIIVQGKRIIIKVNGKTTVDYMEPEGVTGGRKLSSGTVAIQGHDPGSIVHYRNIMIKPLDCLCDWTDLFDGKSLNGWTQKNGTASYEVKDGTIVGTTKKGSPNSFLCTDKLYGDFELEFDVNVDSRLNSGVQIRSNSYKEYRDYRVHGYQVEIATNGNAGLIYDEARRPGWLSQDLSDKAARGAFKDGQWNKYNVVCKGDSIRTWVNGVPVANDTDGMTRVGFIGLQVHGFGDDTPAKVAWRNIRIKGKAIDPVIKAVVLTGGHGYEKEAFEDVFKGHDDIKCVQYELKDDSEIFEDISGWDYDVIVLYNMTQNISDNRKANFKKLLEDGVGLFMTHHAMGAWNEWDEYARMTGTKFLLKEAVVEGKTMPQSGYKHDVDMEVHVEPVKNTVTLDMKDFAIHDETYNKCWFAADNVVLLTTDEPTSNREICWVRGYGKARVCGLELGHDSKAYANDAYRRLIAMGIRYCAGH
jgi:type 1 glutamine amidotransferase